MQLQHTLQSHPNMPAVAPAAGGRTRSDSAAINDPVAVIATLGSVHDTLSSLDHTLQQLGAAYNASYHSSDNTAEGPAVRATTARSQQATTDELARDLLHAAAMTHQAAARLERAQALLTELCYDVHLPAHDIPQMPPRRVPGMSL